MFGMKSLKGKMIVFIGLILIISIGISTFLTIKIQRKYLLESKITKLNIITNAIEKSLAYDMKLGRSDKVQKIIEMIGRNGDLRKIRIFSKNGTILKSDNRKEIGKIIDSIFIHSVKDRDTTLFHEAYSI